MACRTRRKTTRALSYDTAVSRQWTTEVTRDRLAAVQQELEWALQRQNQHFAQLMPGSGFKRPENLRRLRRILLVLVAALAVVLAALVAVDPSAPRRYTPVFVLAGVASALALVMAAVLPRVNAWSRRVAGEMLARRAGRILRPLAAKVPVTIAYTLDDTGVSATCAPLGIDHRLSLTRPALVLHGAHGMFVFRRGMSLIPERTFHASDDDRTALLEAFGRAGVRCEEITRPVDGYADAIPRAEVR